MHLTTMYTRNHAVALTYPLFVTTITQVHNIDFDRKSTPTKHIFIKVTERVFPNEGGLQIGLASAGVRINPVLMGD